MKTFKLNKNNGKENDYREDWEALAVETCVPNQTTQTMDSLIIFTTHTTNGYTEDWVDHVHPDVIDWDNPEESLSKFLERKIGFVADKRGLDITQTFDYLSELGFNCETEMYQWDGTSVSALMSK